MCCFLYSDVELPNELHAVDPTPETNSIAPRINLTVVRLLMIIPFLWRPRGHPPDSGPAKPWTRGASSLTQSLDPTLATIVPHAYVSIKTEADPIRRAGPPPARPPATPGLRS